jgi:outer membrane protein assembly factor BamB
MLVRLHSLLLAWTLFFACAANAQAEEPTLRFLETDAVVEAAGLPAGVSEREGILTVHVVPKGGRSADLPAVAGSSEGTATTVRFKPRFGFEPGIRYRAELHLPRVAIPPLEFEIPKEKREPTTVVERVFPSADTLPENHLRFYVHFSAPMSRGFTRDYVRLLDADGVLVDRAFLALNEELWDPEGKRLTLFFDPGRVKRGLRPREEDGPVLEAGKSYMLEVPAGFEDANGEPLRVAYRKAFRAGPVDYSQPAPEKWTLERPDKATREPLSVKFESPLDHGMLQQSIEVIGPGKTAIEGSVTVSEHETRWTFAPDSPWDEGPYRLRIDRLLEDGCGNSIERQFEIARAERRIPAPQQRNSIIDFEIGATPATTTNWPGWRGPNRNGISLERNLPVSWSPSEKLVWRAETAGPGASTPVVWGDRIFITAQTGRDAKIKRPGVVLSRADKELRLCVQCFNRTTGKLLWEKRFKPEGTLTPTHTLHNQCTPSCVTNGKHVVAWFATGQLFCFTMDGELTWQKNLASEYGDFDLLWAHASSPALFEENVYLLCDHNPQANLVALELESGDEIWTATRGDGLRSYSTPLIVENESGAQLIVNSNPGISSYDALTGKRLWNYDEFCKVPVPVPVVVDGVLYTSRGYSSGPFMALPLPVISGSHSTLTEKNTTWRMPSRAPYVSSPLVYNDRIYLSSEKGQVFCLARESGEMLWSRKLGEVFWSSPVAGAGKVYLLGESGEMVVLSDGPELSVLARNRIGIDEGDKALGSPSISHGCLFFRSSAHLYCVGSPSGE